MSKKYPEHYTAADIALIERIQTWMAEKSYKQAALARLSRVAASTLSQILGGTYITSPSKQLASVNSAMRHADETSSDTAAPVETSVYKLAHTACDMARRYRNFAVLPGHVGVGKTFALKRYLAMRSNTHMIEATPTMTPSSLVKLLARKVVGFDVKGIRTGVAVTAGVGAAAYTLSGPAKAAMSFDERLANMANTAYAERDAAGRKVGMGTLEAVINKSTQPGIGGGTREQAAEALDAMIAKNVLGYQRSLDFLPTIMRTASGANADPTQIANLASVLVGQKVVSNDSELKTALNMITSAGQAGGFEIKDMARWLSQQMPLAGKSGMMGLDGLQKVLTMNQAAVLTAGTTDEAGNNVKNLLAKLASNDTAGDFKKAGRSDLTSYMMNQRLKGNDAVTAWMNIIDSEAEKDPRLKAAVAKLNQSKDKGEQAQILESIKALSEGGVIGKYFQDMQAVGALMGLRNKDVVGKVDSTISKNRTEYGVNDVNYEVMSSTSSFQVRAAQQAKDAAQKSAMDELTPAIGAAARAFTDLAIKHPVLAGAGTLATGALVALAGAAGLASLTMGGGKGGAIAQAALQYGSKATKFLKVGGIAGAAAMAGDYALDKGFGEDSAISRYGSSALNGAAMGAMAGSIVPVIGTGIGAAIGGGLGLLYEALKPAEQKPVDVNAKMTVGLAPGLVLQNQSMQTSGGNVQMNTGSLWGTP